MSTKEQTNYSEENIRTLEWQEHVRLRPGMYIGKLGDGSSADDGIYILLKEVIDNSIDEFRMKAGKRIEIKLDEDKITVRDYGRGIPLGKVVDVVSKMNTGGKYDSKAFKKSVGLNGVGTKAVNALSTYFKVKSVREGQTKSAEFSKGNLIEDFPTAATNEENGTEISFIPDAEIFVNYKFRNEYIERMLRNYAYLNPGLKIIFNGEAYYSEEGLKDLLTEEIGEEILYPIIHLKGEDIEVAITHSDKSQSETYFSFVNGQNTTQGGTHLNAFREAYVKTIREFFNKNFDASDVRKSIIAAISVNVEEPVFESQTKTKLGSRDMGPDGPTILKFVGDYLGRELDLYLHQHSEEASILLQKIQDSERERKAMSGVTKLARERAKKANLHNKKLRDCTIHYNDAKAVEPERTSIFITEGNSASGSITTCRDPKYQAVFSLRGKPLNCYGMSKKVVYENEEFNLLQAALNIEDGLDGLRYNRIIIATDADDDGMHIRLLIITFFLQFFPELVRRGHLFILETPLFRVFLPKEAKQGDSFSDKAASKGKTRG